ncbi:MAG: M64 family metallopeptidase, partial [Gammaproteobacteria bacterium]|nr:M64 family metallopeptidase [Gammaproteobacteria bacterium]
MKKQFILLLTLLLLSIQSYAQVNITQQDDGSDFAELLVAGDADKYDLVIMGDGFTLSDQELFNEQVDRIVSAIENTSPYSNYPCAFNVWRVNVVSQESGVDDEGIGSYVDTELDVRHGLRVAGEVPRGYYSDDMPAIFETAELAPDHDGIIVLANDTTRGGTAFGDVVIMAISSELEDVFIHELGHSFGNLADEYSCYYCDGSDNGRTYPENLAEPAEANVTINLDRETAKWAAYIDAATPIPTIEDNPQGVVGLWEGARYYATGIYRSRLACNMLDSDTGSFCPVCRNSLVSTLEQNCYTEYYPRLPMFEILEFFPEMLPRIRWPIPVCLSCPYFSKNMIKLHLVNINATGSFRIINLQGDFLVDWQKVDEKKALS